MPDSITRRAFNLSAGIVASSLFLGRIRQSGAASIPFILNPERQEHSDLRKFMTHGIGHIYNGAIDRRYNCMPFVRFNLNDSAPNAIHIPWGCPHMVGRFSDALAVCAPIIKFEADNEADSAFRKYLHDCLDNKFCMPFHITLNPSDPENKSGWIHNCREVLLGLLGLARRKGDVSSLELAKKFVRAIDNATKETGTFPSGAISSEGWGSFAKDELNMTSGRLIRALLVYYHDTGDTLGIEIARRFADVNIRETFTPDGGLKPESGNHLHSTLGTMTGLLDLGYLTGETSYSNLGRLLYENGLKKWRTSYGWAKEYKTYDDKTNWHYDSGEANNTGDYIEAALILGKNYDPSYFADAECFVLNGLLASQLLDTDWIVQSDKADERDTVYSEIRKRSFGAFVFTTPNGYKHYHTDLMGGALQSLAETYNSIVTKAKSGVHVNMFFPCELNGVKIETSLPKKGFVRITAIEDMALNVRLPDWIEKETLKIKSDGKLKKLKPAAEKNMLTFGQVQKGFSVELAFNPMIRETKESAPGYENIFDIKWNGAFITGIRPLPDNGVSIYK